MLSNLIDRIGDYNPQLFRELKGGLTKGKVSVAIAVSIMAQVFLSWIQAVQLPSNYYLVDSSSYPIYNRYCTGGNRNYNGPECIKNFLGQWDLRWELWWFDLFFFLSIVGIFLLLLGGTYLLALDLIQENKKGTLNFIRLSPLKAKDFLIGKMTGVPSLLYLIVGLAVPLHFWTGLQSHISPDLILAFYLILGASCAFFYSIALLLAFVTRNVNIPSALGIAGMVFSFLVVTIFCTLANSGFYPYLGLIMLNPGVFLTHLAKATLIPPETSGYFGSSNITEILWYGKAIWSDAWGMIITVLLNYAWWTYIAQKGIQRLYNSPNSTLFSKIDSYWISGSFTFIWFGFTWQNGLNENNMLNLFLFQVSLAVLFFILIGAISPHRQTLLDWSRYRHYNSKSLWQDLIVGEKSPSIVAILFNSLLVFCYLVIPFYLFLPNEYKLSGIIGLVCQTTTLCLFALVVQLILMLKVKQRRILAISSIFVLTFSGLFLTVISRNFTGVKLLIDPFAMPFYVLYDWTSLIATLVIESLAFLALGFTMKEQIKRFGESETKALLG